jgi:hypothetical protein
MNSTEYLALARRIAKHQAPAQVKVDPDRARLELIQLAAQKLLAAKIDAEDCEFLRQVGITDPTEY